MTIRSITFSVMDAPPLVGRGLRPTYLKWRLSQDKTSAKSIFRPQIPDNWPCALHMLLNASFVERVLPRQVFLHHMEVDWSRLVPAPLVKNRACRVKLGYGLHEVSDRMGDSMRHLFQKEGLLWLSTVGRELWENLERDSWLPAQRWRGGVQLSRTAVSRALTRYNLQPPPFASDLRLPRDYQAAFALFSVDWGPTGVGPTGVKSIGGKNEL